VTTCQPHMINCEGLEVSNFENVIDIFFFLIIILISSSLVYYCYIITIIIIIIFDIMICTLLCASENITYLNTI